VADLVSLQIEINASRALDQAKAVTHALGEVGKAGEQAALAFSVSHPPTRFALQNRGKGLTGPDEEARTTRDPLSALR
jgi:hypothetical protein